MVKLYPDFRLIEIEYELWALRQFLNFMEPQIAYLSDQDRVQTFAQLKESGWDHDEAELQLALQGLSERQEYVVPRFMRGPFIVALWACYEGGVGEVAEFVQRNQGTLLALKELRGGNVLMRMRRYFEAVLAFTLDADDARYARLADLLTIRNSLAHANGQRRAMSAPAWDKLTQALKRQGTPPDDHRGIVILSGEFVRGAFDDVNASLRDLVNRARGGPSLRMEGSH